jgi:hypothetical protein
VAGRKTEYLANAALASRYYEPRIVDIVRRYLREEGGKVVYEEKGPLIVWVFDSAGAAVSRTQVAFRVVGERRSGGRGFSLSLPWALRPVGRY